MYWIYLAIFVLALLTPKFIQGEWLFFREEDIESLLIFCFGAFGFMIYLAKEKTLLRVFREKLHLQKQTNMITRDLSESYSYIGEMNRKFDIVKDLIFNLPKTTAVALKKKEWDIYSSLLETVSLLSKTDEVALCFVNIRKKTIEWVFQRGPGHSFTRYLDIEKLLDGDRFFWEEQDFAIVRSPRQAAGVAAFLIVSKTTNRVEDGEIYKILASEALLLYCFKREALETSQKK